MTGLRVGGAARAALVGAALGIVWVAAAGPASEGVCRADAGFGCLGAGLLFRPASALAGGLLAWALLALLRVPRATRTAGAGFAACVLLLWSHDYVAPSVELFGGLTDDAVLLAAGYGLAHLLVAAGTRPRVRAGVGAALLAVLPLSQMAQASAVDRTARHRLDDASVPLLAPDVPGYRVHFASVVNVDRDLHYFLQPRDADVSADDRDEHGLWVTVQHRPAGFAPPQHCDAADSTVTAHLSPCTPVAAGVWRVQRDDRRWYVVQPPGRSEVVLLTTEGSAVPEKDVVSMAADLRPRDAGFFGNGG